MDELEEIKIKACVWIIGLPVLYLLWALVLKAITGSEVLPLP